MRMTTAVLGRRLARLNPRVERAIYVLSAFATPLVLALGGDAPAATALGDYFEVFRRNYVASKPHMVLRED